MVESSLAGGGVVGINHRVETLAGAAVLVDVLQGFAGPDEAPAGDAEQVGGVGLRVMGFSVAGHGSVSLVSASGRQQGVFRYHPQPGFVGLDYFRYWLGDGVSGASGGVQVPGWVEVRVRAVNRPPVARADLVLVEGDGPVTFQILANDSDPDGDDLRITGFTMPAKGQLALNADQSFTYTPGPGFLLDPHSGGHDGFTYGIRDMRAPGDGQVGRAEAQVTLLRPAVPPPANVPPVAVGERVTTSIDTAITIDVLANDIDADGDALRVMGLTVPLHGHVALNADQTVTYTPAPGFTGIDDFTYVADDGRNGQSTGIVMVEVTA